MATGINIPKEEYERLARHFLPQIQAYFESKEGKKEYEQYLKEKADLEAYKAPKSA